MTDTLKLKAKMVAAGLTQEALAQMLEINQANPHNPLYHIIYNSH